MKHTSQSFLNTKLISFFFDCSCIDFSIWSVSESILEPHNGITEHMRLVLLFHLLERSLLHFVLEEVQHFNLKLGVELGLLEDIKFRDNLVESINLQSLVRSSGFDVRNCSEGNDS